MLRQMLLEVCEISGALLQETGSDFYFGIVSKLASFTDSFHCLSILFI